MTIMVEVAPEKEPRLQEEARRAGLPVTEYAAHILAEHLNQPMSAERQPEENWDAILDALAVGSETRPVLPEIAFDRASF